MGKTIIISNRLPVKISKTDEGFELKPSEGGLATGLGSIYRQGDNVWVGWPGIDVPDPEMQAVVTDKLDEINLSPVFLTPEEINLYYEGFSNEILWPICHYFPSYTHYEQVFWDSYRDVNNKFKEAVLQLAEPGDVIWVHDYQLLLLPGLVRQEMSDVTIGFFQHIPFPSAEIFRLIPWRAELLEGMVGADLVGFHTYDDVRHFLSSVSRLLPVRASANVISVNDRPVVVESFPMGIDYRKFEELTLQKEVLEYVDVLKKNFSGERMILSIDRLDYSKGILPRLQAIDLLFKQNPEHIEKVVLYMIIVPSRDTVAQYKELHDQIDQLVGNINARYRTLNWIPIHYYYRSFPVEELSALYNMADICLVTPLRDGMNLVCKEYVASRTKNTGVLILSELAGAAKELVDALIVNPNNIGEIYRAIIQALEMPLAEQQRRMTQMREVVAKFNIRHWVKIYMDRLKEVKGMQRSMETKFLGETVRREIANRYVRANKRIIFLDYDGTLVGFNANINLAAPDKELYALMEQLTADSANRVVLISGRHHNTMEEWFGSFKLDIIAEHGAWQKKLGFDWVKIPGLTNFWKPEVQAILETFTDRTPGSFIEEKTFSLVWHYRRVEAGLGELRANELMTHLRVYAGDKGLQLLPGNKVVEIKNMEINKGKAALNWLEDQNFDFILAMGDDHTDEDIFKVLPPNSFSIKINAQISAAQYYLRDFREARRFLKELAASNSISA